MRFYIIGIDDNSTPRFTAEVEQIISQARAFSGGVRHRQIVGEWLKEGSEWIDIVPPMSELFERFVEHREVVVFASGDPLFYGFAQTVQRLVPDAEVVVFPHFNSLQALAHRALLPYQDMVNVSLTGRAWYRFDEALIRGSEMVGVLTDRGAHTPQRIAQRMLDYGFTNYSIVVGELLGNAERERVREMSVEEVAGGEFEYPNNLILRRKRRLERWFGIPDKEFNLLDGRERMITKMAIRLVSLSQLNLMNCESLWDIGFCTGSISIEAKQSFPHLRINAFEVREEGAELIEANMRRFSTPSIDYHIGDFCEAQLDELPTPDAVFIGGHGGRLGAIMERVAERLKVGGAVVINSVSQGSYDGFVEVSERCGLQVVGEMKISVDDYNTIKVVKAIKE